MSSINKLKHQLNRIKSNIVKNDIVDHFIEKIKKNRQNKRFRFGDIIVISAIIGFAYIPHVLIKNWIYISRQFPDKNTRYYYFYGFAIYDYDRLSPKPFVYKPDNKDILGVHLFENYETNLNSVLAKDCYFFKTMNPLSNENHEFDQTYFYNRIKNNFEDKINLMMKETIVKDMIETKCTNDKNLLYKDEILNKYMSSEYKYRNELYKELLEISNYNDTEK